MDNEVKERGFTDRLRCPTGLCDTATIVLVQILLLLLLGRLVSAWLPAARALEGGGGGGRGAAARGGGGVGGGDGGPRLRLGVDGVAVVVGDGGRGGGGPWRHCLRRRDGPHHVGVDGGSGGDGGGRAGVRGGGVGSGSYCRLGDGFWWREGEEARNG